MCLLSSFGWGFEICLFMLGWLLGCAYVCIMNQANAGITSWHLRRCSCSVLQQSFIHINVVFSVMPKPSLLSRRTASDALRYHVADIHEDSPHVIELIIRIRSDIGALPKATTIRSFAWEIGIQNRLRRLPQSFWQRELHGHVIRWSSPSNLQGLVARDTSITL